MLRAVGWVLVVLGIALIGLAIANIALRSDDGCEEWCGDVLGAFFSARESRVFFLLRFLRRFAERLSYVEGDFIIKRPTLEYHRVKM